MALRQIRTEEDPILRKISKQVKEITPRTEELIDDMCESLESFNGVVLAAVQVGVLKRICIINIAPEDLMTDEEGEEPKASEGFMIHTEGKDLVVINPTVIAEGEDTQTGSEGCLSIPGKVGTVTRPQYVKVRAFDRDMQEFELEAEDLLARACCHEFDHLDGHLYRELAEGPLRDADEEEEDEEIVEETGEEAAEGTEEA